MTRHNDGSGDKLVFYQVKYKNDNYDSAKAWTEVLRIDFNDAHADEFYLDPLADKPYGMIQCNSAKDLRVFYFDPKQKRVTM